MYKLTINGNQEPLTGISADSTGYEYGEALAKAVQPYVEARKSAQVTVTDENGRAIHILSVVPKGGSVMVTENGPGLKPLNPRFPLNKEPMPEKYLVMVDPEKNNNKFYRMVDYGNGKWGAYYGRIGERQGESLYSRHVNSAYEYPDYMYGIKLMEKLTKGYKDKTECHVSADKVRTVKKEFAEIPDRIIADLVRRLMDYANNTIKENYTVTSADVTDKMIEEAAKELDRLRRAKTLKTFNKHLLELLHTIPRRIDGYGSWGVQSVMASNENDFAKIILRERDLLSVMKGQVEINKKSEAEPEDSTEKAQTILDALGLEIYLATDKQKERAMSRLGDSLKRRVRRVYRVINKKTQKAFDGYVKVMEHETGKKLKIMQLWHGSKNRNWMSILQKGLLLNPDAQITGKMFGNGLYFAPSSMKSWNYTSARGTTWAGGNSDTAFMALYATAYGEPHVVYSYAGNWSGFGYADLQRIDKGKSCVHAKSDKGMLRADEIIFYRQEQCTINYLVEFNG